MSRSRRDLIRRCVWLAAAVALVLVRQPAASRALTLSSSAFAAGVAIPTQFACDGANLSPPLTWSSAPPGTKAFALIMDDPDAPAGTWVHWVVYDVPAQSGALSTGVPANEALDSGAQQGVNDFRKVGYGGPCPPAGPAHRYFFKLYALDASTRLPARASKADVLKAIQGHVLAEAQLMGTYRR